jgi:hypothetical protein
VPAAAPQRLPRRAVGRSFLSGSVSPAYKPLRRNAMAYIYRAALRASVAKAAKMHARLLSMLAAAAGSSTARADQIIMM